MTREEFLAQELLDEQEENRRLRDRIGFLTMTIAHLSAGLPSEVSADQFSLLVGEQTVTH